MPCPGTALHNCVKQHTTNNGRTCLQVSVSVLDYFMSANYPVTLAALLSILTIDTPITGDPVITESTAAYWLDEYVVDTPEMEASAFAMRRLLCLPLVPLPLPLHLLDSPISRSACSLPCAGCCV